MAIQDALAFLGEARRDDGIRRALDTDEDLGWADLVRIAAGAGYEVTVEELQRAHALDWQMRWARYASEHNSSDTEKEAPDAKTDAS